MLTSVKNSILSQYTIRSEIMQKQVFRHYDIRGEIGSELLKQDFYTITRAVIQFMKQQGPCRGLAVGRDGRTHSEDILQHVITACQDEGVNVHDIGVCSTPLTIFAQYQLQVDGGLMITASHNPAEYNGLKIYHNRRAVYGEKLEQIYELCLRADFLRSSVTSKFYDASDMVDIYVAHLAEEFADLKDFDFHCFLDCGNGVAGPILKKLIAVMGWKHVQLMFEEVDGTYPNHEADPTKYKNVSMLHEAVTLSEKSFGIAFDGDVDRLAVVSKDGLLQGDQLLTLFADYELNDTDVFVCDIKSSSVVHTVSAEAVFSATGCCSVVQMMNEKNAKLGGELSGHFFFRNGHPGYDDGIYGMMRFFAMLARQNISCDTLVGRLPKIYATGDIRIPCSDDQKYDIVKQISEDVVKDKTWNSILIDGVRFSQNDNWGLIRAANTQPMLSVCCQASNEMELKNMKMKIYDLLKPYISEVILQQYLR